MSNSDAVRETLSYTIFLQEAVMGLAREFYDHDMDTGKHSLEVGLEVAFNNLRKMIESLETTS